jgi:hypothetical protein
MDYCEFRVGANERKFYRIHNKKNKYLISGENGSYCAIIYAGDLSGYNITIKNMDMVIYVNQNYEVVKITFASYLKSSSDILTYGINENINIKDINRLGYDILISLNWMFILRLVSNGGNVISLYINERTHVDIYKYQDLCLITEDLDGVSTRYHLCSIEELERFKMFVR